jgi:hypothetical protein
MQAGDNGAAGNGADASAAEGNGAAANGVDAEEVEEAGELVGLGAWAGTAAVLQANAAAAKTTQATPRVLHDGIFTAER